MRGARFFSVLGTLCIVFGMEAAGAQSESPPVVSETPVELLRRMYESSDVLVLATASHQDKTPFRLVEALLEDIGTDPRLKIVAFEREKDQESVYERLLSRESWPSSDEEAERMLLEINPSRQEIHEKFCSPEPAYVMREFVPAIRKANAGRNPGDGIRFVPIDGMLASRARLWPMGNGGVFNGIETRITENTCGYGNPGGATQYVLSSNREQDTANAFLERVVGGLAPGEKAIVIYHYVHVIRGFSACMMGHDPNDPSSWFARQSPSSWGEIVHRSNPEISRRMKTVFLDSGERMYPDVNLKATERLNERLPGRAWAFETSRLRREGLAPERGLEVLSFSSRLASSRGFGLVSESYLDQMFDALMHIPDSFKNAPIGNAAMYFPKLCAYR